jgi:magnesium transporter
MTAADHSRHADATAGRLPVAGPLRAESFDFHDRSRTDIPITEIPAQAGKGRFVWVDVDCAAADPATLRDVLPLAPGIDLRGIAARCAADQSGVVSSLSRPGDLLHIVLVGGAIRPKGIVGERLDVILGESFLLTMHHGASGVIDAVRKDYVRDFETHAATPSFLIYEMWSKQIEQFFEMQGRLEQEVDAARREVRRTVDADTLDELANVNGRLLALRKLTVPARRVLEEMLSRKTLLISDATLGFMARMVEMLERLLADITSDLDVLSSAMEFSLAVSAHRTNQSMNRLTVMSTLFLPLTFLCGVYGMNFEFMPEIRWQNGYAFFWMISVVVFLTLYLLLRRARLL